MINSLSLPGYQLVDSDEQNEDIHFRLEAPTPVACEGCGVQGEFVRFGKRDVPYRDLPIHGKRVTLWVVRRRYTCRACKTTFRPQLPEMVDGFRMTLRLHEGVLRPSPRNRHQNDDGQMNALFVNSSKNCQIIKNRHR